MQRHFQIGYRDRRVDLEIDGDELVLSLEGVARKRRRRGDADCVYVWTNVELEWEDHHYLEGRWWPTESRVQLTVNGRVLFDESLVED